MCSFPNELDTLNERRREMLRLSISKIQTMNASNVFVSLRKSLLIFNTMKSLQVFFFFNEDFYWRFLGCERGVEFRAFHRLISLVCLNVSELFHLKVFLRSFYMFKMFSGIWMNAGRMFIVV